MPATEAIETIFKEFDCKYQLILKKYIIWNQRKLKENDRKDHKKRKRLSPELADIVGKKEVIFLFNKYFISLISRYS